MLGQDSSVRSPEVAPGRIPSTRCGVSFNSDPLGDDERGWLGGRQPRTNVRRMWFAVLVLIVILIGLWWLIFRGLFNDDKLTKVPSPSTTAAGGGGQFSAAEQRVIEDARRAL